MLLRCPDCREAFKWDAQKPWPRFCPCCGEDINNDRDDDDIVMPFVSKAGKGAKFSDQLYSEMEKASEARVHDAAAMAGVDPSEMAGLKITNMRDGSRPGDIHAPPVNNEVSRAMAQAPQATGFQGANGAEYGSAVMTGPHPNVGAQMRSFMRANHLNEVIKNNLPTRNISSDLPARETFQPGYRIRG